jgi:predicted nucleic-acid-binding Zn-ribbon protein
MRREQVGKCPKCGGEMKPGMTSGDFRILKPGDLVGDRAEASYCQDCGFVELYKEPSTREPGRRPGPLSEQEQPQQPLSTEEPQKPQEKESKREIDKRLIR